MDPFELIAYLKKYIDQTFSGTFELFDETKSYAAGDYVIYENKIYQATENVSAGAWDASKWQVADFSQIDQRLDNLGLSVVDGALCQTFTE